MIEERISRFTWKVEDLRIFSPKDTAAMFKEEVADLTLEDLLQARKEDLS